ncbi:unnamed protein product [Dracunculus medinensis]|uniref:Uncharacterized protein n=1 Tax=Dracunculus medinensis TaxID=318479 RepID=A0A0N4U7H4_DRAME|nr:unnamed protein product [Dracunculus medinensis]
MGSSLSSCGCTDRYCFDQTQYSNPLSFSNMSSIASILFANSHKPTTENEIHTIIASQNCHSLKFFAEIFELSSDRTNWKMLHPSLLQITIIKLSRKCCSVHLIAKSDDTNVLLDQFIQPYSIK